MWGIFHHWFQLQKTLYALEKNTNEKIHVTFSQKPCQKRGNYDQQNTLKQKLLNQCFENSPKALFKMPVPDSNRYTGALMRRQEQSRTIRQTPSEVPNHQADTLGGADTGRSAHLQSQHTALGLCELPRLARVLQPLRQALKGYLTNSRLTEVKYLPKVTATV